MAVISPEAPYSLKFKQPVYAVGGEPRTCLEGVALEGLEEILQTKLHGKRVPIPTEEGDEKPLLTIVFGDGTLESRTKSLEIFRKLPNGSSSIPLFLQINSLESLPPTINRDLSRRQNVNGAAHCSVIYEGNRIPKSAWWASTQGNYRVIEDNPQNINQLVIKRIEAHFCAPFVSTPHLGNFVIPWSEWKISPTHQSIYNGAQNLGDAKRIEDRVDISQYTTDKTLARIIEYIFNKNGIGESMRSELDPRGYIGVTRSGGGKINVDPNPEKGHIVPVYALTEDGYGIPVIQDKPASLIFAKGSVETHGSVAIRLARSLALDGKVKSFKDFVTWLRNKFSHQQFISLKDDNLPDSEIGTTDHIHGEVAEVLDTDHIKVAWPDRHYCKPLDYACGTRHAEMAVISGAMTLDEFYRPGGLDHNTIIVNLDGHGCCAIGRNRQAVTQALIAGTVIVEPRSV